MEMTFEMMLAELSKTNIALSSRKIPEELKSMAATFLEDCGFMPFNDFKECMRLWRRQSRYFPTPYDILQEYSKLRKSRTVKMLTPSPLITEKQRQYNLKQLSELRKKLKLKRVPAARPANRKGETYADFNTEHAQTVREQAKTILTKGGTN